MIYLIWDFLHLVLYDFGLHYGRPRFEASNHTAPSFTALPLYLHLKASTRSCLARVRRSFESAVHGLKLRVAVGGAKSWSRW